MSLSVETTPFDAYQEQRELHPDLHVGVLIVGGYAPVKAVLIESETLGIHELTREQKAQWEEFSKDPLHGKEPDFRVLGDDYLSGLTREEAMKKRLECQKQGRFALNRYGRMQATAAGLALRLGFTDYLILTGGKNKPGWVDAEGSLVPQEVRDAWPSQAELMKDIIRRQLGKKTVPKLSTKVQTETESINMIEQVVYTANEFYDLNFSNFGVLFFGDQNNRDLDRFGLTAQIFLGEKKVNAKLSTNALLDERAQLRKQKRYGFRATRDRYQDILHWMIDPNDNPSLVQGLTNADRWMRSTEDPKYFWYWGGYLWIVQNVETLQNVFDYVHTTPGWEEHVQVFVDAALTEYYDKQGVSADQRITYDDIVNGRVDLTAHADAIRESARPYYGRGSRREEHVAPEIPKNTPQL